MKQPLHSTHDRLGRQVSAIVDGVSTNLFTYDALDLVSETQNGVVVTRDTDALGHDQSLSLNSGYQSIWNYDTLGRVDGVAWAMPGYTNAALFGRIANSDLSAGWSIRPVPVMGNFSQIWSQRSEIAAADPLFAHERGNYDLRGLVGEVANTADTEVFSHHRYDHDALGRRTARVDSGAAYPNAAFDRYGYNGRSEVVSGQRYYGTDSADTSTPYGGRAFGYDYDAIGNRLSATDQIGGATLTRAYTANALNQYTAIDNPAAVGLRGEAVSNATVTVNSETVARDQPVSDTWPWHFALDADNDVGPDFPLAEIAAVINPPGTNDPDIVELRSGFLYAPPQAETMTHDDDGNLTGDGRYLYAWDAENRLIAVEEQVCPTNRALRRVEYDYDHQSRRIARHEYIRSGSQWQLETASTFVYNGWNLIAETIQNQQSTITNQYVWGLDLSGTRTGAGGIGGLLAASLDGVTAFYCHDANGNVGQLSSPDGDLLAQYEYSPFGEMVVSTGPLAKANPFRFSTKYHEDEGALVYFGYRYYSAETGRWLSRDPTQESGGINLYTFAQNDPLSWVDPDGGMPSRYPLKPVDGKSDEPDKPGPGKPVDPSNTGVLRCVYRPGSDSSADKGHTWLEWPETGTILIKNPCSAGYNWLNCGRFCCPDPMESDRRSEVTCTPQPLDPDEYDHDAFTSCLVNKASEHQRNQKAPGFSGKCSEYADYLLRICEAAAKRDKENKQ